MQQYRDTLIEFYRNSPDLTLQIFETLAVLFILWLFRFITLRIVQNRVKEKKTVYKWRKNLTYFTTFLALIAVGQIWLASIGSIATFLGLLSAGLAIALKEPVTDLAAWLFIIWRKPFDVGDRIQLGVEARGDVIDIRPFKFTILEIGNWVDADQSTGRVIHIPNHKVFSSDLANYTSDFEFIWNEISVLITFESDWKKAKKLLKSIVDEQVKDFVEHARDQVKRAEKSYLIQYRYLTPIVYTSVKDSGVSLTMRYLSDPRSRRAAAQGIWESVLEEFRRHEDIDFAYPTIRYFDNPAEGKKGANPSPRP